MKNTINILSNKVINQIAAGEVIQRPASVLKELLENSIDAGGNNIQIIIKNSGKSLIQIIDDGYGMNPEDAKICFQKHTTSKIKTSEDIMKILTMGFRGEALASIASISEVELKTKTKNQNIGTSISIDNAEIKKINQIATKTGTSISVKNLFFNVPARKNFLKSDKIEMKHILETFIQIAISKNEIGFKFTNDGKNIYNLPSSNLKQRVIQLFGKRYNEKILPIEEETSIVSINGFLGNPLDAKKTRGEQFLYVNNRFIKSPYLNHAIKASMETIISKEHHPSYFIFLNISPELIDVNVHPSKTEIKFEDEKSIYQILKSACKKSIGMHNIKPSLDFSIEESFEIPIRVQNSLPKQPKLKINTNFNPFDKKTDRVKENVDNYNALFIQDENNTVQDIINIDSQYALFTIIGNNSINLINKKKALERITYEKTQQTLHQKENISQLIMEPIKIELNKIDIEILKENISIICSLGYNIQKIDNNIIEINSIPSEMKNNNTQEVFESFLEEIKEGNTDIKQKLINKIAKRIAYNKSMKHENFNVSEKSALIVLINKLLECQTPFIGIDGKPCVISLEPNQIFS